MATPVGVLEIQMLANLARLSKDMSEARRTVGSAVSSINKVLGTIGVGVSFAALSRSIIKANIDMERFTQSLIIGTGSVSSAAKEMAFVRQEAARLGLDLRESVDQYSKLTAASKGTELQGQATRDIFIAVSQAATVLGLSADQAGGALTAIQQIISKGTVSAEELRGQLGERLPGAFQIAARSIGVTTQELDKLLRTGSLTAEQLLPKFADELNRTFGPQAEEAAKGLNAQINRFETALFDLQVAVGETGLIKLFTDGVQVATAFANVVTRDVIPAIQKIGEEAPIIGQTFSALFGGGLRRFILDAGAKDQIVEVNSELEKTEVIVKSIINPESTPSGRLLQFIKEEAEERKRLQKIKDDAAKKAASFVASLKQEAAQLGKTTIEIKRMEAAQLGVLKVAEPYLKIIEDQLIAEEKLRISRDKQEDDLRKIEQITDSVKTKQEIYNETVAELDRLLSEGLGLETYNRALQQAKERLTEVTDSNRRATDEISQLWIQAGRNIQNTLADSIFNFFRDGLKGLVSNVGTALGRIASQFAAINIARSLGIGSLLGGAAGTASASSGGVSGFDIASLGSSALNLFNTGFGATGLIGGGLSGIGSALGLTSVANFGAGLAGTAGTFTGSTAFIGGAGTALGGSATGAAAGLGSSIAAAAGPAVIVAAVDFGLRKIFGDKKLGGAAGDVLGFVPILGTLINGLFGRSAPKFNREELVGTVTGSGFEGALNQGFKEKGGAFRSSRFSNFIFDTDTGGLLNQAGRLSESGNFPKGLLESVQGGASSRALEIGAFLDESFTAIAESAKKAAEQLGIGTSSLDSFSAELDLVSEKGETLSQEQIASEIGRISDEMVRTLIPTIDQLSRSSETATQTLSRLGFEFNAIESALRATGLTAEKASQQVKNLSFDERTSITDRFGGASGLASETSSFVSNVFTNQQKFDLLERQIKEDFNIDFIPSIEQLYAAFTSGNPKLQEAALRYDDLIVEANRLKDSIGGLDESFAQLSQSAIRGQIDSVVDHFKRRILELEQLAASFRQDALETRGGLSVSTARSQIQSVLNGEKIRFRDVESLKSVTPALRNRTTEGFSSRLEFERARANDAALIDQLVSIVDKKIERKRDYSEDLYNLLRRMTDDGQSLKTTAA